MSKRAKRHIASFLIALAMAAILLLLIVSTAEAKNVGMISRNADGDVFLSETGWVQVGSDTYYSHKTKSTPDIGCAHKALSICISFKHYLADSNGIISAFRHP